MEVPFGGYIDEIWILTPFTSKKTRKWVLYAGGHKENNVIVVNVQR